MIGGQRIAMKGMHLGSVLIKSSSLMETISGIGIFVMMVVVVLDGSLRLFSSSIGITVELTSSMMVLVVFGALAHTEIDDNHVRATVMLHYFSDKINNILRICGYFISILVSSIFTWEMFSYTLHVTKIKKTALSSTLPIYPFCWAAVVGISLLLMVYIYKLILCFSKEGDVL